ncbi:3-ketodihydrosphingosine reductase [Plakobranchus ocellatus]|uniref:3-dehydrosphinganine reductase n=1 Tax=Plakobranchus ocellatus TaxID=259542 RepID=A0AAV4DU83_9GAST|nr:3-ketodihydrosphingosine reductase [Plakobranchus ocellatus]
MLDVAQTCQVSRFNRESPDFFEENTRLPISRFKVTGGSSGIGKSLAVLALKGGAKVTIAARDKEKLLAAQQEIASHSEDASKEQVQNVSVDLSKDLDSVQKAFDRAESTFGPIKILINCAGTSTPGCFEDLPISSFQKMMDINYMSAVHATRAVVAAMKSRCEGRIVFVSSQAGQVGLFGFTSYSASKFALRGLAEALQMELAPYNIHVTLAFPPDTNTPGFQEEEKTKPEETKLISQTSGLFSPEKVAATILSDTLVSIQLCRFHSKIFISTFGLRLRDMGPNPFHVTIGYSDLSLENYETHRAEDSNTVVENPGMNSSYMREAQISHITTTPREQLTSTTSRAGEMITNQNTPSSSFFETDSLVPLHSSTPLTMVDSNTSPMDKHYSNFLQETLNKRPNEPFTPIEEKLHTRFVKRKLYQNPQETITCKTGGQPIVLKKIVVPRKENKSVKTPTKKKQAKLVQKMRDQIAGPSKTLSDVQ